MAGRVQGTDAQGPYFDGVAARDRLQVAAEIRVELFAVRGMHVDGNAFPGKQVGQTVHVVEVVVADEGVRHFAPILLGRAERRFDVPGRIDDGGLARALGADQVHEIVHRPELHLSHVEAHPVSALIYSV